jgi:hypothetical protein
VQQRHRRQQQQIFRPIQKIAWSQVEQVFSHCLVFQLADRFLMLSQEPTYLFQLLFLWAQKMRPSLFDLV